MIPGFAATLVFGEVPRPSTDSLLVTGSFVCSIRVVDPPGPGVPERWASVNVFGVLGLPVTNYIGTGGKLGTPTIAACDSLAAKAVSIGDAGGCAMTEVAEASFTGSNSSEESRSFSFVCEGASSRVTSVLAKLMRIVMKD